MLLNHTSGLDDFFLHASIDKALQAEPGAAWSVKRTLRYVAKPYFPPGTGWHYSNTNYLYLGLHRGAGDRLARWESRCTTGSSARSASTRTWYQAAENAARPRPPTAIGSPAASRSATPIDLSDGSPIMPFTSVVTASGRGRTRSRRPHPTRLAGPRLLYTGEVLGPDMTALMLDGVAGHGRLLAARPVRPRRPGVPDRRPPDRRPQRPAARVPRRRSATCRARATTIAVLTNQSRADPGADRRRPPRRSCSRPIRPASAARNAILTDAERAPTRCVARTPACTPARTKVTRRPGTDAIIAEP